MFAVRDVFYLQVRVWLMYQPNSHDTAIRSRVPGMGNAEPKIVSATGLDFIAEQLTFRQRELAITLCFLVFVAQFGVTTAIVLIPLLIFGIRNVARVV